MDEFVNEIWKPIEGFGHWQVSNFGRIRSGKTGRVLKQGTTRLGYKHIVRIIDDRVKSVQVHRIVAIAFLGHPCGNRNEINHIDGNKANNHVSNLEWVSRQENMEHAWSNGLIKHQPSQSVVRFTPEARKETVDVMNKGNKSGFKGVTQHGSKWRATISLKGKQTHLGVFESPELAHIAYRNAIAELGE